MATITPTQQKAIADVYTALFNRAPDADGFDFWVTAYADGASMDTILNGFLQSPESRAIYPASQTGQQFIVAFYQTVFGRLPESAGLTYWLGQLANAGGANSDAARVEVVKQIINAVTTELTTQPEGMSDADYQTTLADRARFENKSEVGVYFATVAASNDLNLASQVLDRVTADPASVDNAKQLADEAGQTGSAINLTTDQDFLTGTSANDTFNARVVDNSNTFQSGDVLDGGAGTDTLNITLGNSANFAILAETTNIEIVSIRNQAGNIDNGLASGVEGNPSNDVNGATIDAELMRGVQQWWSSNSRSDLTIEDVRILDSEITKDITIGWRNTDPGDVDYSLFFSPESLRAAAPRGEGAQLTVRLQDVLGAERGDFLSTLNVRGVQFQLNGETIQIQSDDIQDAQTYPELLQAFQAALAALKTAQPNNVNIQNLRVIEGDQFLATAGTDNVRRAGTEVIIVNDGDGAISNTGLQFLRDRLDSSDYVEFGQLDTAAPEIVEALITSTIVLDNVGRGSEAGDLLIGNMSTGNSGSRGVEQFDLIVEDSSRFDTLRTTNNTLEVVTIVNRDGFSGDLTIEGSNIGYLQRDGVNTRVDSNAGIADVRLIQAATFKGDLDLSTELTSNVKDKYLNLVDTQANPAEEDVLFGYNLGTGDDTFTLGVSEANLGNHGVGYADLSIKIDTGAGNDEVNFAITNELTNEYVAGAAPTPYQDDLAANGSWYTHQANLRNISIETGAGNDTVRTPGAGDLNISTGTGDDTIYVDNSGGVRNSQTVRYVDPVSGAQTTGAVDVISTATFLLNNTATGTQIDDIVSLGAATYAQLGFVTAQVSFLGFESAAIDVAFSAAGTTKLQINQAIKAAVNNDAVLNKLLVVADGPNQSLVVTSLVDGVKTLADFDIDFGIKALTAGEVGLINTSFPTAAGAPFATPAAAEAFLQGQLTTAALTGTAGTNPYEHVAATNGVDLLGADSTFESNNIIDAGAGNDVIVLGTGAVSNDVVDFNGFDLGLFSVAHFEVAGPGIDQLDFSAYLTADAVLSGGAALSNAANVGQASYTAAAGQKAFDAITAADILAVLTNTAAVSTELAGLDAAVTFTGATIAAGTPAQSYVILLANGSNVGEYTAFELTSSTADTTIDAVRTIGTIDFGTDDAGVSNFAGATTANFA